MRLRFVIAMFVATISSSGSVLNAQQLGFDKEEPRPRRLEFSVTTGVQFSTDWSNLVILGTLGGLVDRVLIPDLSIDAGTSMGLAVTYWEGRYGFRVNAGFTRSCLAVAASCGSFAIRDSGIDNDTIVVPRIDANAYSLDIGGAIGLVRPDSDFPLRPYVFFGAGGLAFNLDNAARFLLPSFLELGGRPGRIGLDTNNRLVVIADASPFLVSVDQPGLELLFAGVLGFGTDMRVPIGKGSLGLRFEAADYISRSPLEVRLAGFVNDFHFRSTDIEDVRFNFGLVHSPRVSIGLVVNGPLGDDDSHANQKVVPVRAPRH
jgi:hypothetical protein